MLQVHRKCSSTRSRTHWLITNLLTVALLAGAMSLPTQALAAEQAPTAPAAVKYLPGKINKTPVGGPVPDSVGAGPQLLNPATSDKLGELVQARTANSKTSSTKDGQLVTEFFQQPVNFKDSNGKWQPIDNKLVAGTDANAPVHNAANELDVSLPRDLATGAARVESGGQFVEFLSKTRSWPAPRWCRRALHPKLRAQPLPTPMCSREWMRCTPRSPMG